VTSLIALLALVTAVAAAVRSTWSPCGLSMMSSITPVAERARGNRYPSTAAWFVVGAAAGGALLGGASALFAAAIAVVQVPAHTLLSIAAAGGALAALADGGIGPHFPLLRRQVDESWRYRFRGWFYGVGFGLQIGAGVATYIMTAAVFLAVLLAALTASPLVAVAVGTVFGLCRGLAVLLTWRVTTPAGLRAFHQRFDALGGRVRLAVIGLEVGVAVVASVAAGPPREVVVGGVTAAGAGLAAVAIRHRARRLPDRLRSAP
jgi:hypothetical protein